MSNLSDFLVKPLPGVTKADANTLQLSAALPEFRVIATDTAGTGADAAVLRMRNVRQANGAGPNIYLEGTNNASTVKTLVRAQAKFLDVTAAAEKTALVLTVLAGPAASAVELRGDTVPNFSPAAAAGFGLGTLALPWLESWVGNAAGTRYVKATSTGPGTDNALITEGGSLVIYNGAQATLTIAAAGLTVGALTLAGATNGVGIQTTLTASGGHTGNITGHAVTMTAQAGSGTVTGYQLTYTQATDYGLLIQAGVAGDDLAYGVYIDTTAEITTAAFFQKQRAAATGSFLVLQDSSANAIFTVDYLGGIATNSLATFYGATDHANTNWLSVVATPSGVTINTDSTGTGTTQNIAFQADATTCLQIITNGDVVAGKSGLVVGATSGHLYIPAVAGVMTGVPTARAGFVPIVYDTTNNKITVYNAAWKQSAALA